MEYKLIFLLVSTAIPLYHTSPNLNADLFPINTPCQVESQALHTFCAKQTTYTGQLITILHLTIWHYFWYFAARETVI